MNQAAPSSPSPSSFPVVVAAMVVAAAVVAAAVVGAAVAAAVVGAAVVGAAVAVVVGSDPADALIIPGTIAEAAPLLTTVPPMGAMGVAAMPWAAGIMPEAIGTCLALSPSSWKLSCSARLAAAMDRCCAGSPWLLLSLWEDLEGFPLNLNMGRDRSTQVA